MSQLLSSEQLHTLCNIAIQAAQEAGQWVERFDRRKLRGVYKDAGSSEASQIVTEVDYRSEEIIRDHLRDISEQLNIGFVGEESALSTTNAMKDRFEKPHFWCVDPLDGTLPFFQGRSGYAISIALVERSGKPLIGVVYDPACQRLYHAVAGEGAYRDLTPFKSQQNSSKVLEVYADSSFKKHTKYEETLAALEHCAQDLSLNGTTFNYGCGAVKNACQVMESHHACYLKLPKREEGGGSIWDFAATACIAPESGAWVSDIYGDPLKLNRRGSTFMHREGVIFASNYQIAECLIGVI